MGTLSQVSFLRAGKEHKHSTWPSSEVLVTDLLTHDAKLPNAFIDHSPQDARSVSPSERMSYRPWVVWSVGPWDLGTAGAAPANGTNIQR